MSDCRVTYVEPAVPWGDALITFGMHKGKTVAEVHTSDPSYLKWVVATGSGTSYYDEKGYALRVLAPVVRRFLKVAV